MKKEVDYKKQGKRIDGRKFDELRKIKIVPEVLSRADGSCYIEWGQNKAIASVYGPKPAIPKHTSDPFKAVIKFNYRMAGFSVSDHKNPRPGRRDIDISTACANALSKAVLLEKYPGSEISIFVQLFDSNAGTRITALVAASVALASAGIAMRDLVSGVAVGRAFNELVVDLIKEEEDASDAVDFAFAVLPNLNEMVLLQADGIISKKEFQKLLGLGFNVSKKVYEIQKNALLEKYEKVSK